MKILKKIKSLIKTYVPVIPGIIYIIAILSGVLYVSFLVSESFADFFNQNISQTLRLVMAKMTGILPFSIAETLLFTSPVLVFLVIRRAFDYIDGEEHGFGRCVVTVTSVLALLFSIFTLNFAAGYRGATLDEKLGYGDESVTHEQLLETAEYTVGELNSLADKVEFTSNGSVRAYTHKETVAAATESYSNLSEKYEFVSNFKAPVKRLAVSPLMTYTHISGMYTFFTGEANLNFNYPEYINVFTVAHEMAHQRGIARENEANFVAYLVCIGSDDVYLQYSGHLNMLEYLISAIGKTSKDDVRALYSSLDKRVYDDLVSYSEFFKRYSHSTASKVAETVNDTYLQSQGTPGSVSYGMVVSLAVKHYLANEAK